MANDSYDLNNEQPGTNCQKYNAIIFMRKKRLRIKYV